jgi:hypothetical protein
VGFSLFRGIYQAQSRIFTRFLPTQLLLSQKQRMFCVPWRSGALCRRSAWLFPGSPLSRKGFANRLCSHGIRRIDSFKKFVGAHSEMLGQAREVRDGDGKQTTFNSAEGFPMDTDQFSQTFLRQPGFKSCALHVLPDAAESFAVVHRLYDEPIKNC